MSTVTTLARAHIETEGSSNPSVLRSPRPLAVSAYEAPNRHTTLARISLAGSQIDRQCASLMLQAITSKPEGANYEVRNNAGQLIHSGVTPGTVTLKSGNGYFKSAGYSVKLRKDGYAEAHTTINSSLSGWYWGNILLGGLIGMVIVDPVTGAMWKLPEASSASLAPLKPVPLVPAVPGGITQAEPIDPAVKK
jgi:hypothetical protein